MSSQIPPKHDGQMVKNLLDGLKIKQVDFGAEMSWDASKTSRMLNESSWSSDDILQASQTLGVNLFNTYQNYLPRQYMVMVPVALLEGSPLMDKLGFLARRQMIGENENRPPGKAGD